MGRLGFTVTVLLLASCAGTAPPSVRSGAQPDLEVSVSLSDAEVLRGVIEALHCSTFLSQEAQARIHVWGLEVDPGDSALEGIPLCLDPRCRYGASPGIYFLLSRWQSAEGLVFHVQQWTEYGTARVIRDVKVGRVAGEWKIVEYGSDRTYL